MIFWAVQSQVMIHGSTNTTLKRSGKVNNVRLPIPHNNKKFRRSKSRVKKLLIFYIRVIVYYESVPTGQTVSQIYYLEVLQRVPGKVRWKRPKILPATHGFCITTMHLVTRHCL